MAEIFHPREIVRWSSGCQTLKMEFSFLPLEFLAFSHLWLWLGMLFCHSLSHRCSCLGLAVSPSWWWACVVSPGRRLLSSGPASPQSDPSSTPRPHLRLTPHTPAPGSQKDWLILLESFWACWQKWQLHLEWKRENSLRLGAGLSAQSKDTAVIVIPLSHTLDASLTDGANPSDLQIIALNYSKIPFISPTSSWIFQIKLRRPPVAHASFTAPWFQHQASSGGFVLMSEGRNSFEKTWEVSENQFRGDEEPF